MVTQSKDSKGSGTRAPKMDNAHARLIANAEKAIKAAERALDVATSKRKAAKEQLDLTIDRLRKLADEITNPGIMAPKDKK